jgi:hypothetical protein
MTEIIEAIRDIVSLILILMTLVSAILVKTGRFWEYVAKKTNRYCPNICTIEVTKRLSRASLGAMIYNTCNQCLDQGYMSPRDREWVIENYEIYEEAGGNGKVKDAYYRSLDLPPH